MNLPAPDVSLKGISIAELTYYFYVLADYAFIALLN